MLVPDAIHVFAPSLTSPAPKRTKKTKQTHISQVQPPLPPPPPPPPPLSEPKDSSHAKPSSTVVCPVHPEETPLSTHPPLLFFSFGWRQSTFHGPPIPPASRDRTEIMPRPKVYNICDSVYSSLDQCSLNTNSFRSLFSSRFGLFECLGHSTCLSHGHPSPLSSSLPVTPPCVYSLYQSRCHDCICRDLADSRSSSRHISAPLLCCPQQAPCCRNRCATCLVTHYFPGSYQLIKGWTKEARVERGNGRGLGEAQTKTAIHPKGECLLTDKRPRAGSVGLVHLDVRDTVCVVT